MSSQPPEGLTGKGPARPQEPCRRGPWATPCPLSAGLAAATQRGARCPDCSLEPAGQLWPDPVVWEIQVAATGCERLGQQGSQPHPRNSPFKRKGRPESPTTLLISYTSMQNIFGNKKLIIKKFFKNLQKRKGSSGRREEAGPPSKGFTSSGRSQCPRSRPMQASSTGAGPSRRLRVRAGAVSASTLCGASPEKEAFN